MKKILIIFILVYTTLLNGSDKYELKLYEKVLPSIFTTTPIKVYVDKNTKELLKNSNKFEIMDSCDDATVLLIGKSFVNIDSQCQGKPMFSTSYRGFKNGTNSFGAFYWRKGRPQIRFKRDVLDKYNLFLPNSLQKYAK